MGLQQHVVVFCRQEGEVTYFDSGLLGLTVNLDNAQLCIDHGFSALLFGVQQSQPSSSHQLIYIN